MKRKIIAVISSVILIALILFGLAYRYLIEREEELVVNNMQIESTSADNLNIVYDDWNYECDSYTINIKKNEEGTGDDKVTYFVADILINDSNSLKTAFAKNKFGRNIIETTSSISEDNNAIFSVNGDYYGFREDGIIIRNGTVYRDSPAREGMAIYGNGEMKIYDESTTTAEELVSQGVVNTFSFGPALLKDSKAITDFNNVKIDTNIGNRSIQNENPRTGIGIIEENHFVFVVVDGRSRGYSRGMTLNEFASLFEKLGCRNAYNLDGGGSSTMYFNGRVVNNPNGKNKEREVSDIIYIN